MGHQSSISIVIPAKNEAENLRRLLPRVRSKLPNCEIIVVNDGSTDDTSAVCEASAVREIRHPYSMGNGAAIKSGARAASGRAIVFMDGDGQHDPAEIPALLKGLDQGYDMVVGARSAQAHASVARRIANSFYNWLSSRIVGNRIQDLTSGLRAVDADKFRQFLYLLPNGFSYPTTITMAFFRAGYPVRFVPVKVGSRGGKSHISPLRDGFRFLIIIFRVGTLYSPLKIFLPISGSLFLLAVGYYAYTFTTAGRFTNMGALLFIASILVFLIGLVSEQITSLMFQSASHKPTTDTMNAALGKDNAGDRDSPSR